MYQINIISGTKWKMLTKNMFPIKCNMK